MLGQANEGRFRVARGCRRLDEETYSKYALGIRKNKYPNRRQHKRDKRTVVGFLILGIIVNFRIFINVLSSGS